MSGFHLLGGPAGWPNLQFPVFSFLCRFLFFWSTKNKRSHTFGRIRKSYTRRRYRAPRPVPNCFRQASNKQTRNPLNQGIPCNAFHNRVVCFVHFEDINRREHPASDFEHGDEEWEWGCQALRPPPVLKPFPHVLNASNPETRFRRTGGSCRKVFHNRLRVSASFEDRIHEWNTRSGDFAQETGEGII